MQPVTRNGCAMLIVLTLWTIVMAFVSRAVVGFDFDQVGLYFAATPKKFSNLLATHETSFITSVNWDFAFLFGYGAVFAVIAWFQRHFTIWGVFTFGFGIFAAIFDVIENIFLISAASQNQHLLAMGSFASEAQLNQIQTLCVLKFLSSALAIVCTVTFYRGHAFASFLLRMISQATGVFLALGCLLFLAGWRPGSAMFVQVGLVLAIVALTLSIWVHGREWYGLRVLTAPAGVQPQQAP